MMNPIIPMNFKFQQCPRYPFVGQTFEIELWLVNDCGKLQMRHEVPFTIKLGFEDESEASCDLFEVVGGNRRIEMNGKCQLKVKLLDVSASFGDSKFVFFATPLLAEHNFVSRGVSSSMTCIRHRLVVENRSQIPTLWFKDKGGKTNCIEMVVKLSDERGQAVVRPVPLKLQLCYSTGEVVSRQNILALSRESKLQINEEGYATLKVRINEVSMRHDGKCFSFLISPDTLKDPKSADISSVCCCHVEVRSKITTPKNKRGLDEEDLDANEEEEENPTKRKRNETSQLHLNSNSNLHSKSHPQSINSNLKINSNSNFNSQQPQQLKQQKHSTVRFELPPSISISSSISSISSSSSSSCPIKQQTPHETLNSIPQLNSTSNSNSNSNEMTEHLVAWAMKALMTLDQIKWTETGREKVMEKLKNGDSTEASRPLFTMSNPNKLIEELVESYDKLSHIHPNLPSHTSCKRVVGCDLNEEKCCSHYNCNCNFNYNYSDCDVVVGDCNNNWKNNNSDDNNNNNNHNCNNCNNCNNQNNLNDSSYSNYSNNSSDEGDEEDTSDFDDLGQLEDAIYPENSLSLSMGIADYLI